MQPQTTFATANPWAQLMRLEHTAPLVRRGYRWDTLQPGKRLYMEDDVRRIRSARKALAQYLKRNGIRGKASECTTGPRKCVWWEEV